MGYGGDSSRHSVVRGRGTSAPTAPARRGGPAGPDAGRGSGPFLTAEYAAKRAAALANPPEDGPSANCLPPGMPGIMGQPYPISEANGCPCKLGRSKSVCGDASLLMHPSGPPIRRHRNDHNRRDVHVTRNGPGTDVHWLCRYWAKTVLFTPTTVVR
jgi:hypothetical protein